MLALVHMKAIDIQQESKFAKRACSIFFAMKGNELNKSAIINSQWKYTDFLRVVHTTPTKKVNKTELKTVTSDARRHQNNPIIQQSTKCDNKERNKVMVQQKTNLINY